jgi:hypothetical protein
MATPSEEPLVITLQLSKGDCGRLMMSIILIEEQIPVPHARQYQRLYCQIAAAVAQQLKGEEGQP